MKLLMGTDKLICSNPQGFFRRKKRRNFLFRSVANMGIYLCKPFLNKFGSKINCNLIQLSYKNIFTWGYFWLKTDENNLNSRFVFVGEVKTPCAYSCQSSIYNGYLQWLGVSPSLTETGIFRFPVCHKEFFVTIITVFT